MTSRWWLISIVILGGCVTQDVKPYPIGWPALQENASCDLLTGRYRNESETTRSQVSLHTGSRRHLTGLLGNDSVDNKIKSGSEVEEVAIDAAALTAVVHGPGTAMTSVDLRESWSCDQSGRLKGHYDGVNQSEGSVITRATVDVLFQRAADGSLVARAEYRWRGVQLVVVPFSDARVDWLRFVPMSAPSGAKRP